MALPTDSVTPTVAARADRRRVGVMYHPRVAASQPLARELVAALVGAGGEATLLSAWEEKGSLSGRLADLDWLVVMGGDGTLVRVGRLAAEHAVPIIGVNFGRLGFLADVAPSAALTGIPRLLAGAGTVEQRLMLRCTATVAGAPVGPWDAVNDVFMGRGAVARAVRLAVDVNGTPVMAFTADGLLVATPTGSTAYSLSAGGPVISPDLDVLVLTPVVPHPVPVRSLVVAGGVVVDVTVRADEDAVLSVDGQIHSPLRDGDHVHVAASPHHLHLLRYGPGDEFFRTLVDRLTK